MDLLEPRELCLIFGFLHQGTRASFVTMKGLSATVVLAHLGVDARNEVFNELLRERTLTDVESNPIFVDKCRSEVLRAFAFDHPQAPVDARVVYLIQRTSAGHVVRHLRWCRDIRQEFAEWCEFIGRYRRCYKYDPRVVLISDYFDQLIEFTIDHEQKPFDFSVDIIEACVSPDNIYLLTADKYVPNPDRPGYYKPHGQREVLWHHDHFDFSSLQNPDFVTK